ncbi:MAG: hypothetical protein HZA68_05055 [Rhodovulum sp.]|nr:hypothetical protein [Rhodovulum sp.]
MSGIDQLLLLARAYGAAHGIEMSTVSWRVFGDTKKLGAIAAGGDIQVRRFERALRWFAAHWPAETAWPPAVPRPHADLPATSTEAAP